MASIHPPAPPLVGEWYQELERNVCFEVVAINTTTGTIAIQYLDGDIDELDTDSWRQLPILPAEPPEDPSDAYGLAAMDDWQDDTGNNPNRPADPLNSIEPDLFEGFDDPEVLSPANPWRSRPTAL